MKPDWIREEEIELVESAKRTTKRKSNGSFDEEELTIELAKLVPFDVDLEKYRKAKRIINGQKRPGATNPDGQLLLPGFNEAWDYEPDRLVSDDQGNIIEQSRALPEFKAAETARAEKNVERAVEQLRRKSAENAEFQKWALAQALAGRPALDLTWGNCIRENALRT